MNGIVFSKGFGFHLHCYDHYHFNDSSNGSNSHYFAYVEKGRYKIVSEKETQEFSAGEVFYIPRGLKYRSYWYGDPEVVIRSFGFQFFPDAERKQFCLQRVKCDDTVSHLLQTIPVGVPVNCDILAKFYLALSQAVPVMQSKPLDNASRIYQEAIGYMLHHPACTMPEVASFCNISQSMLYATFSKVSGTSPNAHRQKILVDKAVQMLVTTDRQVQEISDRLGFSSTFYFRKVLKEFTGKTPSQIRREYTML